LRISFGFEFDGLLLSCNKLLEDGFLGFQSDCWF